MRLLVFFLILFVSCSKSKKPNHRQEKSLLTIIDTATYIKISPQTKIEVLTVEKFIDTLIENYQEEKDSFINWELNKSQVKTILSKSEQRSFLNCFEEPHAISYYSKILVNNKLAFCQILNNGKTTIRYSDTSVNLWYMDDDFSNYFPVKSVKVIPKEKDTKSRIPKPTAQYSKITPQTKIEVLTTKKTIDTTSNNYKDSEKGLNNWTLNKKQIKNILYESREIAWEEWHYLYNHLPAHYSGKLLINKKLAYYSIQAGAMSFITFSDTSIILGYPHIDYKKYFLEGEWKEPFEDKPVE
jgi:hypothetical protein